MVTFFISAVVNTMNIYKAWNENNKKTLVFFTAATTITVCAAIEYLFS